MVKIFNKKINVLDKDRIKKNLALFEDGLSHSKDDGRKPWARYASFDYCFNYFQEFKNKKELTSKENMQNSCLHLAFYLASWGMLRGSSFLLQKSINFYKPLIEYISEKDDDFWKIDVPNYMENNNIDTLIKCADDIKNILSEDGNNDASDILVTKIMLGVFGCVPAFDTYFKNGSRLGSFNKRTLTEISEFYRKDGHSNIISNEANKIKTFEYNSGKTGSRSYTNAKVIDMIFFMEGYKNNTDL